nr:polyketide synthase [Kibdelosporangium sp. MJ126-NF4]CEL14737.1 Enoyl-CoA hydratase [Kibdelosporangium sp. MJ126-NF4]CTQ96633.1 Enoyl-CoA hydratase (EC 4.2.1.17) [Kibdelosporangium sp. MJ126-NF4]
MSGREFGPVTVTIADRVATVAMREETGGNTFTPALLAGLPSALAAAAEDQEAHVVLVTGLADRFSCGATAEYLAAATSESVTPFVRAFARCPLPVVAAMRGHAIGGGLTLGLYADLPVLSERSLYSANFLNYGLVPSYGTTWLLPARLGPTLGTELLWTARGYRGAELRARGAPVRVVTHEEVLPVCLAEANRIAAAPRESLLLLKKQLAGQLLAASDAAIALEHGPHQESWTAGRRAALVAERYGTAEGVR